MLQPNTISRDASQAASLDEMEALEAAKRDLAMYAAIVGRTPTFGDHATDSRMPDDANVDSADSDGMELSDFRRVRAPRAERLSIWIRHVSENARKRVEEARHRLAS